MESHRIPSTPGAADRLHRSGLSRHSAWSVVKKRRQVQWICPHHTAGLSLLFSFFDRSLIRAPGTSLSGCGRLARRFCVSCWRSFSALAVRAASYRTDGVPGMVVKFQSVETELDGRIFSARPASVAEER